MKITALALSLGIMATPILAETLFESGPSRTSLIELYTSEGCSSCPPAEAQMSRLKENAGLWKQFVPVAFHVDYWDRLGWRDRYSSPAWTARQSRYAAMWQSESVYTPAFVLDGKEMRGGLGALSSPNEKAGKLSATSADGKNWSIKFQPAVASADWQAHVALLGAGISSKIGAGENGGRNLVHDFVVLGLQDVPLKDGAGRLTIPPASKSAPRQAVAIWVTRGDELTPVQATGGWLAAR